MDIFRVRLNCIDHYQATPTRYDPQLRNDVRPSQVAKQPKVPVVRVFGSTETGQKVCAHIHGALPYLYIEYTGKTDRNEVGAYIYRLHLSIDHALAVSYRRDQYDTRSKFVARITLVKGIPFYGFHVGHRFYLKIYMFNPIVMTRLADLLQQGVIMKHRFQPFEAHLQYLLQFMIDYNLYGCSYLDASHVSFRAPIPQFAEPGNSEHLWHDRSVPSNLVTDDFDLPRVSHCAVEIDICAEDIVNRNLIQERNLHQDFSERVRPLPANIKLVHSMAGLWKDETRRRKLTMPDATAGSSPFPAEVLVSMSADFRHSQPQGWLHEEEYREEIGKLIAAEKDSEDVNDKEPTFETFVERHPLEIEVKTALQSVEDLYPSRLLPELGLTADLERLKQDPLSSIIVDENKILDDEEADDLFPVDSDEEWLLESNTPKNPGKAGAKKDEIPERPRRRVPKSGVLAKDQGQVSDSSFDVKTSAVNGLAVHPDLACIHGVFASRLTSRRPQKLPNNEILLLAAEEEGLVSRNRDRELRKRPNNPSLKRSLSAPQSVPAGKRPRTGELFGLAHAPSAPKRLEHVLSARSPTETFIGSPHRHIAFAFPSQDKEQINREPALQCVNGKLNFPITKSQDDLNGEGTQGNASVVLKPPSQPSKKVVSFGVLPDAVAAETSLTTTLDKGTLVSSAAVIQGSDSRMNGMMEALKLSSDRNILLLGAPPPSVADVVSSFKTLDLPDVIYQDAYYCDENDVPERSREYAGREFRLESNTIPFLPPFDPTGLPPASRDVDEEIEMGDPDGPLLYREQRMSCSYRSWEIAQPAPTFEEVKRWWAHQQVRDKFVKVSETKTRESKSSRFLSQIDGPTPANKHGFKYSRKKKSTSVKYEAQYMSTMSLEIHVNSRGKFVPNPEQDEVQCIFWCIKVDGTINTSQGTSKDVLAGIIVLSSDGVMAEKIRRQAPVEVIEETEELDLMVRMVEIVRAHDPDILTGYEVHGTSWGYLIERARLKYDYDLCDEFSRMKTNSHGRIGKENDKWGFNTTSTIRVTGRHMINIWRAMRGELNLLQYTMENVVWNLLHWRTPHYSWKTLTEWFKNGRPRDLNKLLRYYLTRSKLDLEILEANELIPRTSEQARLLGVDFFSVFSRGSQYKVESIMFRIAKPENFMLVSPNRKQVGGQNALECLPLVMEPQSAFYSSPVLVLDFQSLYPSVMIAYNLCYSTFLGRIVNWRGKNKMGFTEYKRQAKLLELLKDYINVTPNGMMYVKPEIRKSLLAKMLTEILETRVMVKSGMKQDKEDKTLQRLLNNRQLALKLLANVTYGYTSASFSGRMPCSEIADSIVQTGRETLERAIAFIHSQERWGAEVVYGDTDSLFIHLKGRTRDQAFDIGNEIAKAITDMNPRPVKLKFEKVYHPCVLLAKKRYVGYKYETRTQLEPEFDAKGIETVRRDGTPAEQKIEEKALKILFETADLSQVKSYFQSQCEKIMRGTVSVQDFCFAKEVKLGTYSDKGPPPPGAMISTKRMLEDARAEPQYGERVPYVVITGAPGARLIDRCVAPEELLNNPHAQLDAEYYISKNLIPPLERIFNLVGANVRQWYDELPKVQRVRRFDQAPQLLAIAAANHDDNNNTVIATTADTGNDDNNNNASDDINDDSNNPLSKKTMESYMKSASCIACNVKMRIEGALCVKCTEDPHSSMLVLQTRLSLEEKKLRNVVQLCRSCAAMPPLDEVPCDSKDCPVFYSRVKQGTRLIAEKSLLGPAIQELGSIAARAALEW